ncbi:MAG TPA: efflux RND transporter periplasmic adaptor subunit [Terracidiphilus sp.]|nr:efflux RND transporter periplasmic adaptor subunit [Terracidiphilus sp.]
MLLSGCKNEATEEAQVTVQAEQPEHGAISETITTDAVLAPIEQAAIEPKITAPVKKFMVQRGQRVKAGELLAELENSDLTAAAMDNQGIYDAAEAAYATATKAQVPEDELKAESDVAQAKANLALSRSIVNSRKQLFQEGAIPGRDLDTSQAALVEVQAAYDAAVKHLDSMRSVTHEAALLQAKGELASAKGKLTGAQAQVSYSEIRSPIDGFVTDRPLFAGETAAVGAPLITVMNTATLVAKAHIAQTLAQQLKLGGEAEVHAPGVIEPTPAKLSMISPALDPGSTTVEVWLKIDNHNGNLKVGTPVRVAITGRTVESALKIPLSAVLTAADGTKSVMVIVNDAAKRKKVTLGMTDGDEIQVLSGIDASDHVITVGSYGLDPDTKVKIGKADTVDADGKGGGDN